MNSSKNENAVEIKKAGGAFADGLTLVRLLLTPIIMYLIIAKSWPALNVALLVSVLFAIAALTDIFDDITGGAETSIYRKFGWFDDIADTVLMIGTLAAMLWVFFMAPGVDLLTTDGEIVENVKPAIPYLFVVPAVVIIFREFIVGLVKGFELTRNRSAYNRLGNMKTAFIMFGTCLLLASPWLSSWLSSAFAKASEIPNNLQTSEQYIAETLDSAVFDGYVSTSNLVWNTGLVILWIGAILSLISGFAVLTRKMNAANDG